MKRAFKRGIAIIDELIGSWDIGQNVLQVRETNYKKSHFFLKDFQLCFLVNFYVKSLKNDSVPNMLISIHEVIATFYDENLSN